MASCLSLSLWRTRPRLPSSREAYKGVTSRRLELLMPHGLSDDTSAEAIATRLQLQHVAPPWAGNASSGTVEDVPFEVELVAECAPCCTAHVTKVVSVPVQCICGTISVSGKTFDLIHHSTTQDIPVTQTRAMQRVRACGCAAQCVCRILLQRAAIRSEWRSAACQERRAAGIAASGNA